MGYKAEGNKVFWEEIHRKEFNPKDLLQEEENILLAIKNTEKELDRLNNRLGELRVAKKVFE